MNIEYEEIEGKIFSIKREDGIVFKLGDKVDLYFNVEAGKSSKDYIIKEFLIKDMPTRHFPTVISLKGTIVTNYGIINPNDAAHVEFESDSYKAFNEVTFTVKEIVEILNYKYEKTLVKAAMKKLKRYEQTNL